MINVLVSGVGGDVGQGVVRCLNKSNLNLRIFKISSSVDDSWLYCDKDSFISPTIYENYVSYLIHFINKHKIDIFFPCIDLEIPIISKNKDKIQSETNCKVFVDDYYKKGDRVLDFGCGVGSNSTLFHNDDYIGVDVDKSRVLSSRLKYPKSNLYHKRKK